MNPRLGLAGKTCPQHRQPLELSPIGRSAAGEAKHFCAVALSHGQVDHDAAMPRRPRIEVEVLTGAGKVAERHEHDGAGPPSRIAGVGGPSGLAFPRRFIQQPGVAHDITHREVRIAVFRVAAQQIPGLHPGILEVAALRAHQDELFRWIDEIRIDRKRAAGRHLGAFQGAIAAI